jgi:hypothetical protein
MRYLKSLVLLFALILVTSCKDDNPTDGSDASGLATAINGTQGSSITYTKMDGTEGRTTGTTVFGWDGGQLLNSNFFRLLRLGSDVGTFNIRFNMEKGTKFNDIAIGEHSFTPSILLLQDSQYLKGLHIEGYFSFSNVFPQGEPFTGTIKVYKDKSYGGTNYSISGEIDATLSGSNRKFKAYFWKEEATW